MATVYIDLPLFSPPGTSFGLAVGEIEVPFVPTHSDAFPWPEEWTAASPDYFSKENSAVLGSVKWSGSGQAEFHVSLCGIVFQSQSDAAECARLLESLGLQFHDLRSEA